MLASNDNTFASAAKSLYYRNADALVRERCRAREDAIRHEEYMKQKLEESERHEEYMKQKLEELSVIKRI